MAPIPAARTSKHNSSSILSFFSRAIGRPLSTSSPDVPAEQTTASRTPDDASGQLQQAHHSRRISVPPVSTNSPPSPVPRDSQPSRRQPDSASNSTSSSLTGEARDRSHRMPLAATISSSSIDSKQSLSPAAASEPVSGAKYLSPSPTRSSPAGSPPPPLRNQDSPDTRPPPVHPIGTTSLSRLVIKDGLKGIANSDSEDSSGEDLADGVSFLRSKRLARDSSTSSQARSSNLPLQRAQVLSAAQNKKRKVMAAATHPPPAKKCKNTLEKLVRDYKQDQDSQAIIASIEQEMEVRRQDQALLRDKGPYGMVKEEAVLATIGSDSEARERLAMAIERTEALKGEECFYFFRDDSREIVNAPFPIERLPDNAWSSIYRDDSLRRASCISGFAAEVAAEFALPVPVTSWMADQLQCETDEALCEAYIDILRQSCNHQTSVSNRYAQLNTIYSIKSLWQNGWSESTPAVPPPGLAHMIRVASFCAPAADSVVPESLPTWTTILFIDLALMAVDGHVQRNAHLSSVIAECIEEVLDCLSGDAFRGLLTTVVETLLSSNELSDQLRCRIIRSLPATTQRAYEVRRQLALSSFSRSEPSTASNWSRVILDQLETSSHFDISPSTNYGLLKDMVAVLDIAISGGWTACSEYRANEPTGLESANPPSLSAAEKLHNKQIDLICKRLTIIWSQIKDSGATHLRRMEAKDSIGFLIKRLEYCVRSRVKQKRGAFDIRKTVGFKSRQSLLNHSLEPDLRLKEQLTAEVAHKLEPRNVLADDFRGSQPLAPSIGVNTDLIKAASPELLSEREEGTASELGSSPSSLFDTS